MSRIFGYFSTPKAATLSMSQPVEAESSRSPVAMAQEALAFGATPSSTAPDSVVAKLPVSSRKQRAKPTAPAATQGPRDAFGMTPRPQSKHVYGGRNSAASSIRRSQQKKKKMLRTSNWPNSITSPATSALAIPNLLNSDAPSSGDEEDDIPASAPSSTSAANSVKRPAANKGVQPLFTQGFGVMDTSVMFGPEEEEQSPQTLRRSKAFKKAQAEEERLRQRQRQRLDKRTGKGKAQAAEVVTAEASLADVGDDSDMDVDDSQAADETNVLGDQSHELGDESNELGDQSHELGDETNELGDETNKPAEPEMSEENEESDALDVYDNVENFCKIDSLLRHKAADGMEEEGGIFEILVKWDSGDETWELEEIIHEDAPDSLFDYWESQNGRPDNGTGIYRAFRFTNHRKHKGRHQVLVEWLGYPPEDQTWEMLAAMKKVAPEIYEEYRQSHPNAPGMK